MGEIADMMLEGMLCAGCGEFLGEGDGFPMYCSACQPDEEEHVLGYKPPHKKKRAVRSTQVIRKGTVFLSQRLWRRLVNLAHPSGPMPWEDHKKVYAVLHRMGFVALGGDQAFITDAGREFLEG